MNHSIQKIGEFLLRSTDGGVTWHKIEIPDKFEMMEFVDSLTGYATPVIDTNDTGSFRIYKTTDGGETWEQKGSWGPLQPSGAGSNKQYYIGCVFLNASKGFVSICMLPFAEMVMESYKTDDGGETWTRFLADSLVRYNLVATRWVVLDTLHLFSYSLYPEQDDNYRSTDGGETWTPDFNLTAFSYPSCIKPVSKEGLALFDNNEDGKRRYGSIYLSKNYGLTWNESYDFRTGSYENISCLEFFDSRYGVAFSSVEGDVILDSVQHMPIRTTDGGSTWNVFPLPFPSQRMHGYVYCSLCPNGTGYAANLLELVKTTDFGATWFPVTITTDAEGVKSTPDKCRLLQNYPNPVTRASGSATLSYELSVASHIRIALVDMMGRTVRTIKDDYHTPGPYTERLDVSGLTPGVYLITMFAGNNPPMVRRMVVRD
jgi:photosystem II stability/assembly factor-like uncharacterized protein